MFKRSVKNAAAVTAAVIVSSSLVSCAKKADESSGEFVPRLDTQASVTLNVSGFFGNFEALDNVVNNFNEYYPNVSVSYEQNSDNQMNEFIANNSYIDIFMTSDKNIRYPEETDAYVAEHCLDLSKEDIDLSAYKDEMLEGCMIDGQLFRVPMAEKVYGMVVNKTLLENEGLKVPETYGEFKDICESLKSKGYTPVQGAVTHVYSDMMMNMALDQIGLDSDLCAKLNSKDAEAAYALKPVFERLQEFISLGYTDLAVNQTYPDDNYDGAILTFFEGKVPFWICDSENASGMKKRESKSETFSAEPFDYSFMYVPMGDGGVYEYVEPWYGFSVNKDSDDLDYATEFIRFLVTDEQLNAIADVKGVPSAAKNNSNEKYNDIYNIPKTESSYIWGGEIDSYIKTYISSVCRGFGSGEYADADEAAAAFSDWFKE